MASSSLSQRECPGSVLSASMASLSSAIGGQARKVNGLLNSNASIIASSPAEWRALRGARGAAKAPTVSWLGTSQLALLPLQVRSPIATGGRPWVGPVVVAQGEAQPWPVGPAG